MRKEILRNFLKRLFNRLNENVTADREEGEWQKAFFDSILNADWVLPDLEKEDLLGNFPDVETDEKSETQNSEEQDYETYKQRGFAIAISSDPETTGKARLETFLENMRQLENDDLAELNSTVESYQRPFLHKVEFYDQIIEQIKKKRDDYHGSFGGLIEERKKIEELRLELINKRNDIEENIAGQKKDLLSKWIEEAGKRIKDILDCNQDILRKKQSIAKEVYEANRERNEAIIEELKITRGILQDELASLSERKQVIAGEGSGKRSTKFLISIGYLLSIASGLFFSVFTFKSAFGSNDIATFIFKGLIQSAHTMKGDPFSKVSQLLGVFGIITLVSLLCRSAIVHIRKRQAATHNEEIDEHYLQIKIKNDSIRYRGMFKANNWPVFWFKVFPVLLLVTAIFILISEGNYDGIDNSMMGLVIGSAISLGLAAFTYVYVVKVVEPRLLRRKKKHENGNDNWTYLKWFLHWELTVTFFVFLVTTLLITWWYRSSGNAVQRTQNFDYITISLLWFLSVTLLCAFVIAYGMRFQSINETQEEVMLKKLSYDDLIDQLSGVVRSDNNHLLNQQADLLMQKLMGLLIRRNDVIFKNGQKVHVSETSTRFSEEQKRSFLDGFFDKLNGMLKAVLKFLEAVFLPSEIPPPAAGHSLNERMTITEMVKWEEEYFADQYHLLGVYDDEYERYTGELIKIDEKINDFDDVDTKPLFTLIKSMDKAVKEQESCNRRILSTKQSSASCSRRIQAKYRVAIDLVQKGYELGIWYKNEDPDFKL